MTNVRHGARSQVRVRARAGYMKQHVLMPLGIRQADLSRVGRYLLDQWSLVAAQLFLMDEWVNEYGFLDEDGRPPGFTPAYFAARNAATRLFAKLEPHLLEAAERKAGRGSMVAAMQSRNGGAS